MDKDRIDGAAKQMKGAVKEGVGKAVGDAKLQGEGKADKAAGQGSERRRRRQGRAEGIAARAAPRLKHDRG